MGTDRDEQAMTDEATGGKPLTPTTFLLEPRKQESFRPTHNDIAHRMAAQSEPRTTIPTTALIELIAAAEECADELLYLTESDAARVPIDYTRDTSIVRRLRAAVARVRGE